MSKRYYISLYCEKIKQFLCNHKEVKLSFNYDIGSKIIHLPVCSKQVRSMTIKCKKCGKRFYNDTWYHHYDIYKDKEHCIYKINFDWTRKANDNHSLMIIDQFLRRSEHIGRKEIIVTQIKNIMRKYE